MDTVPDLFTPPMLSQSFYCFKWEANEEHPAFYVEKSISTTREETWDYILKAWPVSSHPRGRKGVKQKIFRLGGRVVPVHVTEFLESKQKPGGSHDEESHLEPTIHFKRTSKPARGEHYPIEHESA